MATVINNPSGGDGGNGTGIFIGIAVLVIAIGAFVVFAWPVLRRSMSTQQINIPDKIDINVNTGGQPATGK